MRWVGFVDVLLSPLGFGLLLALALWLGRRRWPRTVMRIGIALEALCVLLATPIGANALVTFQERRAPPPAACLAPAPRAIVVLSGGLRHAAQDAADFGALNASSLQRTLFGAALAKATVGAELVMTGGSRYGQGAAQSDVLAHLATQFGVPADAIRTEDASRTTWENATGVRHLDPPVPARIWLVTSALHMPRALIAFRAAGFDPCAYPVDFRSAPFDGLIDFLPSALAIADSDAVLHEWAGELVYRWRAAR